MECNREEALRSLAFAQRKFASRDYLSARKFALKAQQLFPSLENIAQMITVIDVHAAAHNSHKGGSTEEEKDWYEILQVDPSADDASVKKQYRKLALFLHPDKNKSVGAESAFKLIGEALQVLSDETKRIVYDEKRGFRSNASVPNINHYQTHAANAHTPFFENMHHNYSDCNIHLNKKVRHHYPPQTFHSAVQLFTFWTACSSCHMRYQYLRKYENQNLLCPQCRTPFIAKDLSNLLKVNVSQSWPPQVDKTALPGAQSWRPDPYMSADVGTAGLNCFASFTNGKHGGVMNLGSMKASSNASAKNRANKNVSSCYGMGMATSTAEAESELYRKIEELQKARKIQKELKKKAKEAVRVHETLAKSMAKAELFSSIAKKKKKDGCSESVGSGDQLPVEASCGYKRSFSSYKSTTKNEEDLQDWNPVKKARADAADCGSTNLSMTDADMAKRLAELAKKAIRMQLSLQANKAHKPAATAFPTAKAEEKKYTVLPEMEKKQGSSSEEEKKEEGTAISTVPDADFHNFDEGREEKDVNVGQIWALYDDKDGMPKYYVKIKEVRSLTPFKVRIAWFEPENPSKELCELLDMGFSLTCGEFRIASSQVFNSVNSFSHLVNLEKGEKGIIKIYPKKGEIWAIHEEWEPGQKLFNKLTTDAPLKCCMVEVVSDCDEATGVMVMRLQKVQGFKTVYEKIANQKVLLVPFMEMMRFSHRVPAYKMNGHEAPAIPEACWELDPAAVPLCLINSASKGVSEIGS